MLLLLTLFLSVSAQLNDPLPSDVFEIELLPPDPSNPSRLQDPFGPIGERRKRALEEESEEKEDEDKEEEREKKSSSPYYEYLYKWMKEDAKTKKKRPVPDVYKIPGPQEPLPGRSHTGDYWPVFPFQNQFSGGLDLDPSISRHIGGDLNLAVPSWGMLDIYGRFFNRIRDTTTKFGYLNHPVNMLDLDRNDYVKLMSDPSLHWNRNAQPRLPLGKLARTYVPLNCKPPLCNPYTMTFGLGIEHDYGGNDGVEGDIDVPIPISKGVAYRLPFSGKIYYARENITVTYGQNLAPIDPMHSLFDYQYTRDPNLAIPRDRRSVSDSVKVWQSEPTAKTFADHVRLQGRFKKGPFRTRVSGETSSRKRLKNVYIVPNGYGSFALPQSVYPVLVSPLYDPAMSQQLTLDQILYRQSLSPELYYFSGFSSSSPPQYPMLFPGEPHSPYQFVSMPEEQWYSDPMFYNFPGEF